MNLFLVQKKNFNYDILRIIQNLQGKYIILCTSKDSYYYLKKKVNKYPVFLYYKYFHKSLVQKIFEILANFFSNKRSFFKFLFNLKLLRFHISNLEYLINKYKINKIVTDDVKFDIFGMSLKKILSSNLEIDLNYIYMYPFKDDSYPKYNSTELKKLSIEYIIYKYLKNNIKSKDIFYHSNEKIFYYFKPSVILISKLFDLNPDKIFSRTHYHIFKNIFFIRQDVKISVEKTFKKYLKSKEIKFYYIFKSKKIKSKPIYKLMLSTAPYYGHKMMLEKDERKLFFSLLSMISKNIKKGRLLSIHPNHSYKEKIFYRKLAKKFKFNISNGGKIVEDLCNSEICIAQPYGSIIDNCVFMKKKFLSFGFPYNKNIFPLKKYTDMMFKIVRTYKNKKYLNKFIFRNEVEFVNKFKQLDKNKSISNVILIPDKLKIRKI